MAVRHSGTRREPRGTATADWLGARALASRCNPQVGAKGAAPFARDSSVRAACVTIGSANRLRASQTPPPTTATRTTPATRTGFPILRESSSS